MKTSSFILFIFTLFSSLKVICQVDSLSMMKNYFRMSDSLCEIGQYEKARDYLHTGSYYRPIVGETKDSRKAYLEEYFERSRKVDVGITYYLTDSIRYMYRVEKGYEWLSMSKNQNTKNQVAYCIYYAVNYFQDAIKYSNGNFGAKDELNNMANALPTDTIVLRPWGTAGLQLIYKRYYYPSDAEFIAYDGMFRLYQDGGDTLYLSKDTALFSGVLTSFLPTIPYYRENAIYEIWEFESGLPIRQTFHYLCPSKISDTIGTTRNEEQQKILNSQNFKGYYCGCSEDWGDLEVWFTIHGDTLSKKVIFDSGYYEVKFHPNGDTSEFLISKQVDEISFCDKFMRWNIEGNRIEYSEHKYSSYSAPKQWSESYILNENGDTISMENWVENMAEGIFIHNRHSDNDSDYCIKVLWRENKLVNFIDDDILFFDASGKLIDEATFLTLIDCDYSQSPENLIVILNDPITVSSQNYSMIAYPESYVLQYANYDTKIWRKIFRSIEKSKLKNE